jgi:hypothetical protein
VCHRVLRRALQDALRWELVDRDVYIIPSRGEPLTTLTRFAPDLLQSWGIPASAVTLTAS